MSSIENNEIRKHKKSIVKELENIKNIEALENIEKYIKDCKPKTLEEYINLNFDDYHKEIRKALEHEVREIYLLINNRFCPEEKYITDFCELYVQGHCLDIWIGEQCPMFNPLELAIIIFKLWTKEIVFR